LSELTLRGEMRGEMGGEYRTYETDWRGWRRGSLQLRVHRDSQCSEGREADVRAAGLTAALTAGSPRDERRGLAQRAPRINAESSGRLKAYSELQK
jgi:hypothetical protein